MSLLAYWMALLKSAAAVVTVTGGDAIHHAVANFNTATAIIRVNADGTIDKIEGAVVTQLQSVTDWIIPNGANDGLYEVLFAKGVLDDAPNVGVALDVWHFIGANREVGYSNSANDTELRANITTRIRYNGGAEIDNGVNHVHALVGTPI